MSFYSKRCILLLAALLALGVIESLSRILCETTPNLYQMDPRVWYRLTPNHKGKKHGKPVEINSKGLRDREYDYTKGDQVYRIVVLGDSFTFGHGIAKPHDIYHEIIEMELRRRGYPVEVINLGVGGYTPVQSVALYKIEGEKYDPDLVLMSVEYLDNTPLPKPLQAAGDSREDYWLRPDAVESMWRWVNSHWYTWRVFRETLNRWVLRLSPRKSINNSKLIGYDGMIAVIDDFSRYLKERHITLVLVLIPWMDDFEDEFWIKTHQTIRQGLERKGVICFDMLPYFQKYRNGKDLRISSEDHHPNELGHALIASFLTPQVLPYIKK